jgi:uncharacterized protein YwqG
LSFGSQDAVKAKIVTADELVELASAFGLEHVADELGVLARVAIRIEYDNRPVDRGGSKLGGLPDLPPELDWPEWNRRPLAHLAQIDLREIAALDEDDVLPVGWLWFFWDAISVAFWTSGNEYGEQAGWGTDASDRGSARGLLAGSDLSLSSARHDGLPSEGVLPEVAVRFDRQLTLPPWESSLVQALDLDRYELDRYVELSLALGVAETGSANATEYELSPNHRLLGHPDQLQSDMAVECELVTSGLSWSDYSGGLQPEIANRALDWRLLLQLGSDEDRLGVMWGDVGRLYFWIREQDLRARHFDEAWLLLQCA